MDEEQEQEEDIDSEEEAIRRAMAQMEGAVDEGGEDEIEEYGEEIDPPNSSKAYQQGSDEEHQAIDEEGAGGDAEGAADEADGAD